MASAGAGRWELGWELFRIASLAQRKQPYGAAKTILAELSTLTGESAVLAVYDRQRAARMYVATSPSQHPVRFVPGLFTWLPMHAGATGLAILAHRPEAERRSIYDKGLPAISGTTLTDPDELESALAQGP